MSLPEYSLQAPQEPFIDPEIWASITALPTEDDLPCDDGEPMETQRHREQMTILIESLKTYWSDRQDYYVGGNMFVYYNPDDRRHVLGPDVFLVLNVEDRERKSWVSWHEGMRFPDVIIELLSNSTRGQDQGEKKRIYEERFRTAEYYLYDPFSQEFTGYYLHGLRYVEMEPDAEEKRYSEAAGLFLAVHEGWLRWMTEDGEVVPTPMELAQRERQRAEQERQRAEQAEQQLEAYRQRFGNLE